MKNIDEKVTATVTSGGRITIPKPFRDALGWKAGTKLDMSNDPDGEIVLTEVTSSPARRKAVAKAIDQILKRRRRLNIDGLTTRCLIDEGRKG